MTAASMQVQSQGRAVSRAACDMRTCALLRNVQHKPDAGQGLCARYKHGQGLSAHNRTRPSYTNSTRLVARKAVRLA